MTLRSLSFVTLVAFALLPCFAPAQVTKTGSAYKLRMKLVQGASYSFVVTASSSMGGAAKPMIFETNSSMKVVKIVNGIADVLTTGTSPMGGKPESTTIKMDARGPVNHTPSTQQIGGIRFPEKAVKIGDSWKPEAKGAAGSPTDVVYTFSGLKTIGKVSCAVIDVKSTMNAPAAGTANGKLYFEVATGMLYQGDIVMNMKIGQGDKAQAIKSTMAIRRK